MKLGQLCKKIGSGATPRGGKEVYLNQGPVSLIRSQNVHNNEFSFSGLAYINELQARELQNVEVEENDLLLNITGDSVARICQVDLNALPARVNQHVSIIRPHPEKLDHLFLKYWFLLPATQQLLLQLSSSGATRKALTKQMLESLDIPDILLNSQKMISNLLYRFDQKIELNKKMDKTMEQMVQAVFQDWFVDFGPVKRKLEGINDPVAILGGLIPDPVTAQDIANLFPDEIADGDLPEGWKRLSIGSFANIKGGKQLAKTEFSETGLYPVFGGAGQMGKTTQYNAEGHVLTVGRVGAYCGQFFSYIGKAWVNNNASLIIPHDNTISWWLFYVLKNLNIESIKKGAAQPFVSNNDIISMKTIFGGKNIVEKFVEVISPILELKENYYHQNHTLAEMRDLLLPKLMSGEISVDELEKKMGGVL